MRLLWLGVFDGKHWRAEYQLLTVLQSMGVNVFPINYRTAGFHMEGVWRQYSNRIDAVLLQNGKGLSPGCLDIVTKPYVYWATEASMEHSKWFFAAKRRPDHIIANSVQSLRRARSLGLRAIRMHNGYDPTLYYRKPNRKLYDVAMLGSMTARRRSWYRRMLELMDYHINVVVLKRYTAREANDFYNSSRIVLHVHAIDETYLPSRFFEVLPTSACLLIEDMGENWDPNLGSGFFETFRTKSEMAQRILSMKRHPEQCELMSKRANLEAGKHTWMKRAETIVSVLKSAASAQS
jgi:hypothetical protein